MFLRRDLPADVAAVRRVHTAAFGGGAGPGPVAEAVLVERLRTDGAAVEGLSIVALDAGAVVGHVVCSRGRLGSRPVVGLGPLGVLPSHQRRGVGTALMHAVLAAADAQDEPAVVCLGEPAFYRRFGFEPAGSVGISAPEPTWGPHFQVRRLTSWDPRLTGGYRYAAAFDAL